MASPIDHNPLFKTRFLEEILGICSEEKVIELSRVALVTAIPAAEYNGMSVHSKNICAVNIVRAAILKDGYFAGWRCLSDLCPHILPTSMVKDALTCIKVYESIRPIFPPPSPTALTMTIVRHGQQDSLYHIPPKSLGGKAWAGSVEYASAQPTWSNTGFEPLSPCVSFGWLAAQRKILSRDDRDHCDAMLLLGTVALDMDRAKAFAPGFAAARHIAMLHIVAAGTRMQGVALAALLNYDVQHHVRSIQEKWDQEGLASVNPGPRAISPADWASTVIGDCTVLSAFAYEEAKVYTVTTVGLFLGMLNASTYDFLYDRATSNILTCVSYSMGAGIAENNIHCIFVISELS
ncbi:hypothetical protein C8R47DRAFT_477036 [Mycena vitilis]|nr:hypothetical protein C8R47DRAFT_477036 [Mycena vitilis]